jgi:nicotinate-nucleotide--dimethylbenzimidazole phosphoribosyltransferase
MSGMMTEAASLDIPVILDGMLSHVCALYSVMTEPRVKDILIPSHMTKEPLCMALLSALSLSAPIDGKMATGEGTGALMLVPLLRLSGEVYEKALKFGESGVEQYERFK